MIVLYFSRKIVRSDENLFSLSGWQGLWQLGVEGSWKAVLSQENFVWGIHINRLLLVTYFLNTLSYALSYDTLLDNYTTCIHVKHRQGFA